MTSALTHEPQALQAPQSFGPYRIATELCADALARTFLACRTAPDGKPQHVRLSVMHPELIENEAHVQRFLDEARLAVAVQHPTVGIVVDAGRADGLPYAAYTYVGGKTLAQFLAALRTQPRLIPRTPAFACHVLQQICGGLHVIHQGLAASGLEGTSLPSGLSTHSLLIAYDGSVRIAGFGGRSWGVPGMQPGPTLLDSDYPYRAPERVLGHEADRRADLWSIGVMLFEAITGIQPFVRSTRQQIDRAIISDPLPVLKLDDAPLLGEIVDACLRRRASDRPEDAAQMSEALGQYLTHSQNENMTAELASTMALLFGEVAEQERALSRSLAIAEASAYLYSSHGRGENVAVGGTASAVVPLGQDAPATDLWARPAERAPMTPAEDSASTDVSQIPGRRSLWPVLAVLGTLALFGVLISNFASPDDAPTASVAPEDVRPATVAPAEPAHEAPPKLVLPSEEPTPVNAEAPREEPAPEPAAPEPAVPAPAPALAADTPSEADEPAAAVPAARPLTRAEAQKQRKQARKAPTGEAPEPAEKPPAEKTPVAAAHAPRPEARRPNARGGARGEPGTVVVGAIDGWAEVYFDGARLGTTPLRAELPSGNLNIEVRAYGTGTPRRVPVVVKAGEVTKVRVPL